MSETECSRSELRRVKNVVSYWYRNAARVGLGEGNDWQRALRICQQIRELQKIIRTLNQPRFFSQTPCFAQTQLPS